jgi:thiol-disulfide isomerase/thioredoxin
VTRRRGWLVAIALLALAQVAAVVLWRELDQTREASELPVGMERRSEPGHDLMTERLDGSSQLVAARSDRFQLIHFWATWCPPCRKELPTLLALERRERDRLRTWIISTDSDWGPIRQFFGGAIPPAVVRDASSGYQRYDVTGLPDSYFLDPTGRIVARFAGGQNWRSPEMERILDRLMRQASAVR